MDRTAEQTEQTVSTRAWLGLSAGVLALAGFMALLVALARTPAIKPFLSPDYFYAALVGHVDLFLVVWYLVMPVVLWRRLGLVSGRWERLSFYVMLAGISGMVVPSTAGMGKPVLANYVPFLVNPLFLLGLFIFLAGVALAAVPAAGRYFRGGDTALGRAGAGAALCVLGSLAAMVTMGVRLAIQGEVVLAEGNLLRIFWAGGHILQFAHTALMLTVWGLLLGALSGGRTYLNRFLSFVHLFPIGAAVGVAGVIFLDPAEATGSPFLTTLKSWGLGVPAGLALLYSMRMWWDSRGAAGEGRIWRAAVGAGMLVLMSGGGIALLGNLQIQTTLIPGHYHAVLTAVAIAFMGLTYYLFAEEGVPVSRLRWPALQPYFFGGGTIALVAGMVWAGSNGAPRKTPGAEWVQDAATLVAMNLWGFGGILAVVGGALFLWHLAAVLYRWDKAGDGKAVVRGAL